jgi:hypothetical protein
VTPHTHRSIAELVASRLTDTELCQLAELLDADAGGEFCSLLVEARGRVAPLAPVPDMGPTKDAVVRASRPPGCG